MLICPKTGVQRVFWPYLLDQHLLSHVFVQKRPGAPDPFYFAQLPHVSGHFIFPSGGLLKLTQHGPQE